jgi:hypothetical protein
LVDRLDIFYFERNGIDHASLLHRILVHVD